MRKKELIDKIMAKYHIEIRNKDGLEINHTEKETEKYLDWIMTDFSRALFSTGIELNNKTDLTLKLTKK